jgi:hypothetical protein
VFSCDRSIVPVRLRGNFRFQYPIDGGKEQRSKGTGKRRLKGGAGIYWQGQPRIIRVEGSSRHTEKERASGGLRWDPLGMISLCEFG